MGTINSGFVATVSMVFVLLGCNDQSQPGSKQEPARQVEKTKAEDWHIVATEESLYLATNKGIYRKKFGEDWVCCSALGIRDNSKVVSMCAIKRANHLLQFSPDEWYIYVLMDSGNLWGFKEGDEMDSQKLVRAPMPE